MEDKEIEVGMLAIQLIKLILGAGLEGMEQFDNCDGGKLKKARGLSKKLVSEEELAGFYDRLKAEIQDEFAQ